MPLVKSINRSAVQKNVGELIASGHSPDQAYAIAKDVQRCIK